MGFYFKSNENIEEQTEVVQDAVIDDSLQTALKSATIVGLLKDYCRCCMSKQYYESFDDLVAAIKSVCNEALDGGDITGGDFEKIINWLDANRGGGDKDCCDKFICGVLMKELMETCPDCSEEISSAVELFKLCDTKFNELKLKYKDAILGYANEFIQRYGKLLNQACLPVCQNC